VPVSDTTTDDLDDLIAQLADHQPSLDELLGDPDEQLAALEELLDGQQPPDFDELLSTTTAADLDTLLDSFGDIGQDVDDLLPRE
jgi:hypothetical protein